MVNTLSPTTSDRPVMKTGARAEDRLVERRRYRFTGLMFILGALLVNLPYFMLIVGFDYPDILRQPTSEILAQFQAGGNGLIFTWLAFAWAGLPILVGIMLLRRILEKEHHHLIGIATTFGVVGGIVQIVGLLRWVFVVPGLAAAYTAPGVSDATRSATEVTFGAIHQYGGVVLGEHLGQLFTIAWMVMVATMMFHSRIFRPWLGWFGITAAAVYSIAQLELFASVIPDYPNWETAGLLGSLLWLAWMLLMGTRLATASQPLSDDPTSGPLDGVGTSRRPAGPYRSGVAGGDRGAR